MQNNRSSLSEADLLQIKEALKRTYKERFLMATRLYKVHQTMSKAIITHKPDIKKIDRQ